MNHKEICSSLAAALAPDFVEEWEIDEYASLIEKVPVRLHEETIHHLKAFWPVSQALCGSFLEQAAKALNCLEPEHYGQWVKMTLEAYETGGLAAARHFMDDVENNFICRLKGESGLKLREVSIKLTRYLQGLSGKTLELHGAEQTSTNTEQVFLPREIRIYRDNAFNFLVYKFIVSFQWAFIANRSLFLNPADFPPEFTPITIFQQTPCPLLAADLYLLAETQRALVLLRRDLPGLMRDSKNLFRPTLYGSPYLSGDGRGGSEAGYDPRSPLQITPLSPGERPIPSELNPSSRLVEAVQLTFLGIDPHNHLRDGELSIFKQLIQMLRSLTCGPDTTPSIHLMQQLVTLLQPLAEGHSPTLPLPFQGRPDYETALAKKIARREEAKLQVITALAEIIPLASPKGDEEMEEQTEQPASPPKLNGDTALLIRPDLDKMDKPPDTISIDPTLTFLTVEDRFIELPREIRDLLQEINDDLGHIPSSYISSGLQMKGSGRVGGPGPVSGDAPELSGKFIYDEWDYRRGGFRKNWCQLFEKNIQSVKTNFVEQTLEKYYGVLIRLRRQFELMRVSERFLRRQHEGDDIDLDALIESLSDTGAGLPPSERLYIKLQRDERSICTVFLVDMSNSTEGWVSKAIKEALVLMCEALEMLGDRYAIYGFSGMRRLRCDLYRIKDFEQHYNDEIKEKIAAIAPREYTRMGPPIRHVCQMLKETDAKIRLLVTITDGKPEDYDDYKGDYAVEDTRHALIEAKMAGIHPFCITIDKRAHDYMAHMFGEINYIFINDVRKLPNKVPEIYRTLTT